MSCSGGSAFTINWGVVRKGSSARFIGVYRPWIDPAQIQQLKAEGMGPSQIAKQLGIGRASVYRALEA
jgi:hypothetical protein